MRVLITNARYSTNIADNLPSPAAIEETLAPWPQGFSASGQFDEMVRDIQLPDEVRIRINAPALESFSPDKPVQLIFYALPNGNTIEQTFGKVLQPGDDWHFDIQHIGAQTRWLRNRLTNRTIVVAYLEAGKESWPAWRKEFGDRRNCGDCPGSSRHFSRKQNRGGARQPQRRREFHFGLSERGR